MKRFHFSLRPIAILRAHHEMRAREAFAAAVQAVVSAEERLAAARRRVGDMAEAVAAGRAERFRGPAESDALEAFRRECATQADAERTLNAAGEAMNTTRVAYVDAHRKLEVVRRLEEKARAAHRHASMREEQAEFDQFATQRFGRRLLNAM